MFFRSFFSTKENSAVKADIESQNSQTHPLDEWNGEKSAIRLGEAPHEHVISPLDVLESKWGNFLETHMQEVKILRETVVSSRDLAAREQTRTRTMTSQSDVESHPRTHVNHVDQCLDDYVKNLRQLQVRLGASGDQEQNAADPKDFESIRRQFEMQLLISTFSASLILSFCSLIKGFVVDGVRTRNLANVGLLLSFISVSCYIFNIAIALRSASLSSDVNFTREHGIDYFRFALRVCEHLYMCGIYVFSANGMMMSFAVFENVAYPATYCGFVALGLVAIFRCRLRHMLVLYRTVGKVKKLAAWVGGIFNSKTRT